MRVRVMPHAIFYTAGRPHHPGEELDLAEDEARAALDAGVAELVPEPEPEPEPPRPPRARARRAA